ncbi:MAG: TVP38/TMEM64 family protein [Clostridia bacterium]|nr:TVP38/TMEM64 family protein [Clostridia bacterium]
MAIVFAVLYIETFNSGFFAEYSTIVTAVSVSLISVVTVLTITFLKYSKKIIYKLFLLLIITIAIVLTSMYILKITGFLDRVNSVEDFRKYISSFGNFAVVLFIIIQFLQVVVLPIPSFITVGAGVLLFGALKGAIFSTIGIILGSIIAFIIGRFFGFKVAKWLVGKDNLQKGLESIKGKDKLILTFMFLFPFFPDDVLCFVAGITTISPTYFIVMIFIVRIITVFVSSYSMNNSIIPYDTWWGILLWALFFLLTIVLTIVIYKYGEKIERFIFKKKKKSNKN